MNAVKANKFVVWLTLLICGSSIKSFSQYKNARIAGDKSIESGWKFLFDGKSFNGWKCTASELYPFWTVKDGTLSVNDTVRLHGGFDLVSETEFENFELVLDYAIAKAGNSGIKYAFAHYKSGGETGMEFQLLDDQFASDNKQANHLCGSLYDMFPPDASVKKLNAPGQWNHVRIVSMGNHVEHWLNNVKVLEYEKGSTQYTDAVKKSKYQTEPMFGLIKKGKILLQDHGSKVSFKNIMIREL